jgi:hypothetical protein
MEDYCMDIFIKIVRIILVISLVVCFSGRAIYIVISGGPLANAIGEGLVFAIFFTLTTGVFCSMIWLAISAFMKEPKTTK